MNYRKKRKETIGIMERKIGEIFNYQEIIGTNVLRILGIGVLYAISILIIIFVVIMYLI